MLGNVARNGETADAVVITGVGSHAGGKIERLSSWCRRRCGRCSCRRSSGGRGSRTSSRSGRCVSCRSGSRCGCSRCRRGWRRSWCCAGAGTGSGCVIYEARDGTTERGRRCRSRRRISGRIDDDHEVMACGDRERVARMIESCSQAGDTSVAEIVGVDVSRVVGLVISDAFDIAGSVQAGVDRHGIATSPAARVGEGEGFVVVRGGGGEPTAGTRLPAAGARTAVPANPIGLSRITCRESGGRNRLIRTSGTGRNAEGDGRRSTRVGEVK